MIYKIKNIIKHFLVYVYKQNFEIVQNLEMLQNMKRMVTYMKANQSDRRVLKTRQAIHEALFSLMQERQYSKITIQDIIDRANVGRSTFYQHFTTKDELLFSSIEHLLEVLNQYILSYVEHNGDRFGLIPVVELFEHIKENNRVIKGLIRSESSGLFFLKVQEYWSDRVEQALKSKLPEGIEPKIPLLILTNHISSTFINLLKWWLDNKMVYSPAQMEHYFQELVNPCIDSVLQIPKKLGC